MPNILSYPPTIRSVEFQNPKLYYSRSGSGLGKRLKLDPRNPRKKYGFCHIIAKYHVPDLWGMWKQSVFPHKTFTTWRGDEHTTFEPLNL